MSNAQWSVKNKFVVNMFEIFCKEYNFWYNRYYEIHRFNVF